MNGLVQTISELRGGQHHLLEEIRILMATMQMVLDLLLATIQPDKGLSL